MSDPMPDWTPDPMPDPKSKPAKTCYIVGVPRSGTTWLLSLMTQHDDIVGLQQSGFFHAIAPLRRWWRSNHGYGKQLQTARQSDGDQQHIGDVLSRSDFQQLLGPVVDRIRSSLLRTGQGYSVLVDQTPENLELRKSILELDPDAYFLHIVRDPRAICSSMQGANKLWSAKFPRRTSGIARSWNEYMGYSLDLQDRTDRYMEIRYEDLLAEGPRILQSVFEWLGLATTPAQCQSAVDNCAIEKLRARKLGPEGFFRSGTSDSWQSDLSARQVRVIEHLCADAMAGKGYERRTESAVRPISLAVEDGADASLKRIRRILSTVKKKLASFV